MSPRRRQAVPFLLVVSAVLVPGCAWMHQRPYVSVHVPRRSAAVADGSDRGVRVRAPMVNVKVDLPRQADATSSAVEGD